MKLGRLLLKRLNQSSKSRSRGPSKKTSRKAPARKKSRLNLQIQAARAAGQNPGKKAKKKPEPQQEIAIAATPTVLPAVLSPVLSSAQSPRTIEEVSPALQTSNLIRPTDRLKQSIEAFLLDQRSEHTRRAYGKDLKRFIQFLIERKLGFGPENLTRSVLIAYKEYLIADGLEHTTVDRHLACLRSFFRWLVDDGHLIKSPMEGVRFLNPKRVSRTIGFTNEEVCKILKVPDLHTRSGAQHYAILMVLFYCGLRRSEVCSLRTSQIGTEREHKVLRLRGKGNAERIVVIKPQVWNALNYLFKITQRNITQDQYLFMPIRNNRTQEKDKAIDSSAIFYIVTKYAREAGVANRVSPHSCRATAISNARDNNVPDRAIQEFAGWASPDMITRYDKRRTSIEKSASHAIAYGAEDTQNIPYVPTPPADPELGTK